MNMEEKVRKNIDLLDSPLWQYLSRAATQHFSYLEQASFMQAHLEWEKEHKEIISVLDEQRLSNKHLLNSSTRRNV